MNYLPTGPSVRILALLASGHPMTAAEVTEATKIPAARCRSALYDLSQSGRIIKDECEDGHSVYRTPALALTMPVRRVSGPLVWSVGVVCA